MVTMKLIKTKSRIMKCEKCNGKSFEIVGFHDSELMFIECKKCGCVNTIVKPITT